MKRTLFIESFEKGIKITEFRPILLDANILMGIGLGKGQNAHDNIAELISNWKNLRTTLVAFIPDFIKLEAINAERYSFGTSQVRRFLKQVEKSDIGFFVELNTPIKEVLADNRTKYIDWLPRKYRHILLANYEGRRGTDLALITLSIFLRDSGTDCVLYSGDKELLRAAEAVEIATKHIWE